MSRPYSHIAESRRGIMVNLLISPGPIVVFFNFNLYPLSLPENFKTSFKFQQSESTFSDELFSPSIKTLTMRFHTLEISDTARLLRPVTEKDRLGISLRRRRWLLASEKYAEERGYVAVTLSVVTPAKDFDCSPLQIPRSNRKVLQLVSGSISGPIWFIEELRICEL